ncbi:MAG: adenylyltransferase/cytidyltransferase family protein [Anaerolineae bacterium]
MTNVVVSGSFDDLRAHEMRFLDEASKLGDLHVLMWSDEVVRSIEGSLPQFPEAERAYFLQAVRYVSELVRLEALPSPDALPDIGLVPDLWVVDADSARRSEQDAPAKRAFCRQQGIGYRVMREADVAGFPRLPTNIFEQPTDNKKVIVTGCYDWLHSGHVRFFEEAAEYGDLYVAVGNDASVSELKGEGHPLFPEELRRYMVQSIRYVTQAVITKGVGWMDAAPNIAEIKPDIYIVNEDGDRPEKRAFCEEQGLDYVVLKREPKEGLTPRSSTDLRGF